MKISKIRVIVPVAILLLLGIGLTLNFGTGTLSSFGWGNISVLCPLGAITSFLAGKTALPRAVFALVLVIAVILFTGRAFCSWVCPVPLVQKLRTVFKPKDQVSADAPSAAGALEKGSKSSEGAGSAENAAAASVGAVAVKAETSAVSAEGEREAAENAGATKKSNARLCGTEKGCAACHKRLPRVDSRHLILGGTVLSALICGFPIFCLICPVGLTFATILLLIGLFGHGDVTWSVIVVPALLLIEVVFFRHWCGKICPMGAFLSLVGKGNKTLHPVIDTGKCLETVRGAHCGTCTLSCEQGINLRNPDLGASRSECTRCSACIDACPAHAISIAPVLRRPRKAEGAVSEAPAEAELEVCIEENGAAS